MIISSNTKATTAKDQPYLDEIIYRIIPDSASRAVALEQGKDLADGCGTTSKSFDAARLSKLPNFGMTTEGPQIFRNRRPYTL